VINSLAEAAYFTYNTILEILPFFEPNQIVNPKGGATSPTTDVLFLYTLTQSTKLIVAQRRSIYVS
jgi:hypothetical protein